MSADLSLVFPWEPSKDPAELRRREWLVTNGLGGYASGTLLGEPTRRYHGLFVPNLPAPRGRTVCMPRLDEEWVGASARAALSGGEEAGGRSQGNSARYLKEFRLQWQIPTWTFLVDGTLLQKRITMPNGQNTVYIEYRLLSGKPGTLRLRPYLTFRGHDDPLGHPPEWPFTLSISKQQYEIRAFEGAPPLRLRLAPQRGVFVAEERAMEDAYYPVERERGLDDTEALQSPGFFTIDLQSGENTTLIASVEPWAVLSIDSETIFEAERRRLEKLLALAAPATREGWARHLVMAADQFIVMPGSRVEENALLQASGDRVRTIIAGYHWFTDWGRDTMISLEGLTLCTGRHQEARSILRTFSHYVRDGLLPNHFPEGQRTALYHTVDASLWYFHAIHRYHEATGDEATLKELYPTLKDMIDHHVRGTRFGIGMDPADALIREGSPEVPLTWMDAKAGDWIVTPRRGKPVEIQALWYNALRLMAEWAPRMGDHAKKYAALAERVEHSFNARFWYDAGGYLYDVIDGEKGNDASLRPNQIFSFSLEYPVLARARWEPVLEVVGHHLWTPVGLRSLSPEDPDYKPRYEGNRRERDGAYHQGLVWGWLLGPYVDAYRRVHPDPQRIEHLLKGVEAHLSEAGMGTISEIFDAQLPHRPRGCIAQAWSVAEALRVLVQSRTPYTKPEAEAALAFAKEKT